MEMELNAMILLIVLTCLTAAVDLNLRPEVIVDWENSQTPYFEECVKETNVDPMIPRLMFRQLRLPDEGEFHCYMKCIFKHNQWLTPDDNVDVDKIAKAIHVKPELAEECGKVILSEEDICRRVYLFVVCGVNGTRM